MVATAGVTLVQTPPGVVFDNWLVAPTQTFVEPVIDATIGNAFTVIVLFTVVEQLFVVTT